MVTATTDDLARDFIKALVDADRLKIVGLLALGDLSPVEIASRLGLKPAQTLHHLGRLERASLVAEEKGRYRLDVKALESLASRLLSAEVRKMSPEDFEGEDYDRKVLSDFITPDGRLRSIPAQHRKTMAVLRHLAGGFEPGRRYPEKQVNEILLRYFDDPASLRRYMVDNGLLGRERGVYWRINERPE
jgi:hypothetical protein